MDAPTAHAWILLSIPSRGAAINEISLRASFLNNGEPTELDLQQSLQWLSAAGLISGDSDFFLPTSAGQRLVHEEWRRESMLDTWRAIGLRLAKNDLANAEADKGWLLSGGAIGRTLMRILRSFASRVRWEREARNWGMLRAYFDDCAEIRMGSPFRLCRLRLDGSWIPRVPSDQGWQNLSATSPNGRFVALVRWDVVANNPGFRILTVDCRDRTVQTTERILGCCESLAWRDEVFVPTIWHPPANEEL